MEEAVERKPFKNPKVVEVELPQVWTVQGKVLSSDSQPKVPLAQVKTLLVWQVVKPAPLKEAVKRLEEEAVVLKKFEVVAFTPLKFCRVEEAFTKRLPRVARPVEVRELMVSKPLASMVRAEAVEVAPVAREEVAK